MRGFSAAVLGAACLVVVSCHKVLGDYEVDPAFVEGGAECTPGAYACVGNVLQQCSSVGDGFENAEVCASAALCNETMGQCDGATCQPGARRCLGEQLQECNATQDGWTLLESCTSAAYCNSTMGVCTDAPCMPGMMQCSGLELQECLADQSGWGVVETCATQALCNASAGTCGAPTCAAGEVRCTGAVLEICNMARDGWSTVEECESASLCDDVNQVCQVPGCSTPGAFRCTNAVLEECAADLSGWGMIETCQSAAHCDANNGRCNDAPCNAGDIQCSAAVLEQCNTARTGWDELDTCDTDGLCQSSRTAGFMTCVPPACDVGDFQCVGPQPQICNLGRTGYRNNGAVCATSALCNATTGTCTMPACAVGDVRCTGAQPEICNPGRTGFTNNGDACDTAALCNPTTGLCGDAVCNANQMRCDPGILAQPQVCNSDQTAWDDVLCTDACTSATASDCECTGTDQTLCATEELCVMGTCEVPACDPGERDCLGTQPLICNSGRTDFETNGAACDTPALCEDALGTANMCAMAMCAEDQRRCSGAQPQLCNDDQNGWDNVACSTVCNGTDCECNTPACASTALCVSDSMDPNVGRCNEPDCTVGSEQCMGQQPQNCPDGTGWMNDGAACVSPSECDPATGNCDGDICLDNQFYCNGAMLRRCNATGTGWAAPDPCDTCRNSTLCNDSKAVATTCNSSACYECSVDETRCTGVQPEKCNSARTGWDPFGAACATAALCVPATGMCTAPTCASGDTRCPTNLTMIETCNANQNGWDVSACPMGDMCTGMQPTAVCMTP